VSVTETTTRSHRSTRLALAALGVAGFVAIGLPDGALGVAWPSIRAEFDRPLGSLGWLLAGFTVGYLGGSALSGPIAVRLGTGRLLLWAAGASAVGFVGYTVSPWWAGLVLFSVALGAGGGALDAGINAHVAVTGGLRSLNLLHAAYGVGATVAPLILTVVLQEGGSWRLAYGLLAGYAVALLIGYAFTKQLWSTPAADRSEATPLSPRLDARVRGLAGLTLVTFFVYIGVEATAGRWSYTLFTEGRGMPAAQAGLWAGAFWLAVTVGRLVSVGAATRLTAERLIDAGVAGMVLGSVLLWSDPTPWLGGVGLVIVGFGAAPVFPTFVHLTPGRLGSGAAAHAIGYQVAISGLAGAAVPTMVGVLAGHLGLEVIGPSMLVGSLMLMVLHRRLVAAASHTHPASTTAGRAPSA
jgi:fucose permease